MKIDIPSDLRFTSASGVVRASRIMRSECCTREIQTFFPFTTYRSPRFTAVVFSFVVSVPVVGSVTPIDWRIGDSNAPQSPTTRPQPAKTGQDGTSAAVRSWLRRPFGPSRRTVSPLPLGLVWP